MDEPGNTADHPPRKPAGYLTAIAVALAGLGALVLFYAFVQVTAQLIRGDTRDKRNR